MQTSDVLVVVSALIIRDNRILLTQRDPKRSEFGGIWETPGGKVNPGEMQKAATRRETREEIGVEGEVGALITTVHIEPPVVRKRIRLTFFRVDIGKQEPKALEAIGIGWFTKRALLALDLTPGNVLARDTLAMFIS